MKYIVILIMIICFWFLLGSVFAYMNADPGLAELTGYTINNNTFSIDDSYNFYNATADIGDSGQVGITDIFSMIGKMFSMRIPFFKTSLNFLVSFFNWMLVLVLAITAYRIIFKDG